MVLLCFDLLFPVPWRLKNKNKWVCSHSVSHHQQQQQQQQYHQSQAMQMAAPPLGLTVAPTQQEHMQLAQVRVLYHPQSMHVCMYYSAYCCPQLDLTGKVYSFLLFGYNSTLDVVCPPVALLHGMAAGDGCARPECRTQCARDGDARRSQRSTGSIRGGGISSCGQFNPCYPSHTSLGAA